MLHFGHCRRKEVMWEVIEYDVVSTEDRKDREQG